MDGAISAYGVEERCIEDCGGETWGKESTWKNLMKKGGQY